MNLLLSVSIYSLIVITTDASLENLGGLELPISDDLDLPLTKTFPIESFLPKNSLIGGGPLNSVPIKLSPDDLKNAKVIDSITNAKDGAKIVDFEAFDTEMADLYPIGDPSKDGLPGTMPLMQTWCKARDKRAEVFDKWIMQKLDEDSPGIQRAVGKGAAYLFTKSLKKKNDAYCETPQSMQEFIGNATVVNSVIDDLWNIRRNFVNSMTVGYFQGKNEIAYFCCDFWKYSAKMAKTVDESVSAFVTDMIKAYYKDLVDAVCKNHKKNSNGCKEKLKEPADPNADPIYRSVQHPYTQIAVREISSNGELQSLGLNALSNDILSL